MSGAYMSVIDSAKTHLHLQSSSEKYTELFEEGVLKVARDKDFAENKSFFLRTFTLLHPTKHCMPGCGEGSG